MNPRTALGDFLSPTNRRKRCARRRADPALADAALECAVRSHPPSPQTSVRREVRLEEERFPSSALAYNPKFRLEGTMSSDRVENEVARYRAQGARINAGSITLAQDEVLARLRRFGRKCGKSFEGFKSLEQELVVYKVLEREDVLAVMPTGSGKSLTYQFPAHCAPDQITLVVSPLRALMKQHAELPGAIRIDSDTMFEDRPDVWRSLRDGERFILLISPEMLVRQHERLAQLPIGRFVVDEVHCLSDWGHDFRPHYWWVSHYLRRLEVERGGDHIPRLLLTATANERVLKDIERHFPEVANPETHVIAPLGRTELVLSAQEVTTPATRLRALVRFLERQKTRPLPADTQRRGIAFNLEAVGGDDDDRDLKRVERWKANEVVTLLRENGFPKTYAFASRGMSSTERDEAIAAFENATPRAGQVTVVVATNAFGMGMDYDGIPFVCHLYPRPSLSEYWQQVGRAGRGFEGADSWAEALALFSEEDEQYALRFAKAPALDGLINSFTIPLHGRMYVWKRGGAEMCLEGEGGGRTQFSRLLEELQNLGLVSSTPERVTVPRGTLRYAVDLDLLRRAATKRALDELRNGRFRSSKRLRKVFRYLAIAARSKEREHIVLDQTDYNEDRYGTVLQRLNRWVDIGALARDDRHPRTGEVRLLRVGRNLMDGHIQRIAEDADEWAAHKQNGVAELMDVLRASSPAERRRRVLRHFGEKERRPPPAFDLPTWLQQ